MVYGYSNRESDDWPVDLGVPYFQTNPYVERKTPRSSWLDSPSSEATRRQPPKDSFEGMEGCLWRAGILELLQLASEGSVAGSGCCRLLWIVIIISGGMWRALHSGWSKYQKPWLPLFFFWRLISGFGLWSSSNLSILFSVGYFLAPAASCNSTGEFLAMLFPPMERKATRSWIRPCNRGSIGIHRSRCPITWLRWSSEQR